jgi:hypothetical protein
MTGLHLPARLGRGKAKPELRAQWIELVATLMARGVKTPSHLRRLLGLNFRTAKNWMDEVEALWARGVSDELLNVRRESLYNEADEVAKEAWRAAMVAETASAKASLLKVLLMANQRKASLTGLDSIEVRVNKRVEQHTTVELVARVEQDHGLAPGALEALGRSAARLLSAPAEEPRALLARPAEPLVVDVK